MSLECIMTFRNFGLRTFWSSIGHVSTAGAITKSLVFNNEKAAK